MKAHYQKHLLGRRIFLLVLLPLVVAISLGAIAFGSADISVLDVYRALFKHLGLGGIHSLSPVDVIIWKLRLPRVLMGLLAGFALGLTGAVMQVVLRNPLADPYMLGISSAASFGASLSIITGIHILGEASIVANAFIFSVLASFLILLLSGRRGATPEKMVLIGLAMLFFFQAMTTLVQYFGDSEAVKAAVFWTVGDLGKADFFKIKIAFPVVALGSMILLYKAQALNIMNSGDTAAKSMGLKVEQLRLSTMVVCTLVVATIVSFTGTIGFVGLVAPHIVRMGAGGDNRILLPGSALVGALLLIVSDTLARTVLSPIILPVGAVTSFLGVPLFLYLITRKKGGVL
jgi:iron complex transport system permease protein